MIPGNLTRRDFLKAAAALTAVGAGGLGSGCRTISDTIATRPVRRDVTSDAAAADVAIYRAAVTAMKALPESDARNWERQAQIHLDFCPHGNWYFLPWHRAYLHYFERICRELTGEPDFALPVWNWQKDRAIPAQFWGANNPLAHSPRVAGQSSRIDEEWTGADTLESILSLTNFEQFASFRSSAPRGGSGGGYGSLEATPHNRVHGFVGGTMGTFDSPLDPVFWCHHNMIDCCWVEWNVGRGNANTDDSSWVDHVFTEFVDQNGDATEISILTTLLMPILSYRFEADPKGTAVEAVEIEQASLREFLEEGGNAPFTVRERFAIGEDLELAPSRPLSLGTGARGGAGTVRIEDTDEARIVVRAAGVTPPADDSATVRVFVNLPDAALSTPVTDPHFAGSFAFFTDPEAHAVGEHHGVPDYYIDVTDAVARLRERGDLGRDEPISLQLVAVPRQGARGAGRMRFDDLSIVTTESTPRER